MFGDIGIVKPALAARIVGAALWILAPVLASALVLGDARAAGDETPEIRAPRLKDPTTRYGHNVLAGNEYATLEFWFNAGTVIYSRRRIELPDDRVFEDVTARLADVTGDGIAEVVVVESSRAGGAELAVYGVVAAGSGAPPTVGKLAATPPIGRRNRWLAPAGIADFDGDGQNDIAYVETPHIGGTLRIWTMRGGRLVQIASAPGFSNHRIGSPDIVGGVRTCGPAPELVLPNFGWTELRAVRLVAGRLVARPAGAATDARAVREALSCKKVRD